MDEEPVAEMSLHVAYALVFGLASALAVEGELLQLVGQLFLCQVMPHTHGFCP